VQEVAHEFRHRRDYKAVNFVVRNFEEYDVSQDVKPPAPRSTAHLLILHRVQGDVIAGKNHRATGHVDPEREGFSRENNPQVTTAEQHLHCKKTNRSLTGN
jgi:hypothetical protein